MMGNIFGRHTGSQKALSNLNALFSPRVRASCNSGSNLSSNQSGLLAKLGKYLKIANHCS